MLLSSDIDSVIGQHHEEKRDVEGHHRAGDSIGLVDHEDTPRGVRVVAEFPFLYHINYADVVPALHYGEKRYKHGKDPAASQH